jgi:hypothetical protein
VWGQILGSLYELEPVDKFPIDLDSRSIRGVKLEQSLKHSTQKFEKIAVTCTKTLEYKNNIVEDLFFTLSSITFLNFVVGISLEVLGCKEFNKLAVRRRF